MKFKILLILTTLLCLPAKADWHSGKISRISTGYSGSLITIALEGWSRNNCTCYSTWPNTMCLDSTRATYDFEKSLILSAKTRSKLIKININEASCKIIAIAEHGVN